MVITVQLCGMHCNQLKASMVDRNGKSKCTEADRSIPLWFGNAILFRMFCTNTYASHSDTKAEKEFSFLQQYRIVGVNEVLGHLTVR